MTQVTQTPPPLKLRRRDEALADAAEAAATRVQTEVQSAIKELSMNKHDMTDRPPSYPMQPYDMGVDLYEPSPDTLSSGTGVFRRAPYQYGAWRVVPSYNSPLHFIIDTKTLTLWSRALEPVLAQGWNPEFVIRNLKKFTLSPEVRWLHCLRIRQEFMNHLKYAIVVADFFHHDLVHDSRRVILENIFPELGIRQRPEMGEIYLIPEFPERMQEDVWCGLKLMNEEWKHDVYDGVDVRQAETRYYMQKIDFKQKTMKWQHYPFAQKYEPPVSAYPTDEI